MRVFVKYTGTLVTYKMVAQRNSPTEVSSYLKKVGLSPVPFSSQYPYNYVLNNLIYNNQNKFKMYHIKTHFEKSA
mgnify:CR=1 FL=1